MNTAYEKFQHLREIFGDETVMSEIINYFSSDDIKRFCTSVMDDYDIDEED